MSPVLLVYLAIGLLFGFGIMFSNDKAEWKWPWSYVGAVMVILFVAVVWLPCLLWLIWDEYVD